MHCEMSEDQQLRVLHLVQHIISLKRKKKKREKRIGLAGGKWEPELDLGKKNNVAL
jgi:hypothetical protein